ncbi:type IV pilus modification PilV family protein [Actinokineospora sp.]|uniref:type IV pilus modification PilV family protein n=1 Tax=Actinokineospora sp. TaxID=1872133 RepID=UPI003D6B5CDC
MRADDRGETLLELLIAVVILGIGAVAIGAGLTTSVLASDVHRKQSTAGTMVRDFGEAIRTSVANGGYVACAAPGAYASPAGFAVPTGYTSAVTATKYWDGTAWQASCGTDTGLQQLTLQVAGNDGRATERTIIVIRKPCGLGEPICT